MQHTQKVKRDQVQKTVTRFLRFSSSEKLQEHKKKPSKNRISVFNKNRVVMVFKNRLTVLMVFKNRATVFKNQPKCGFLKPRKLRKP